VGGRRKMSELKPCPVCHVSEPEYTQDEFVYSGKIQCRACGICLEEKPTSDLWEDWNALPRKSLDTFNADFVEHKGRFERIISLNIMIGKHGFFSEVAIDLFYGNESVEFDKEVKKRLVMECAKELAGSEFIKHLFDIRRRCP
jgi:hypothetical protein